MSLIGVLGSTLLLIAWFMETLKSVKEKKKLVDIRFAMIYILGLSFLSFYAYEINDVIFLFLNLIILGLVVFELLYEITLK